MHINICIYMQSDKARDRDTPMYLERERDAILYVQWCVSHNRV